jgi:antitoxin HigA-1
MAGTIDMTTKKEGRVPNIHPGMVLREDFLEELGISAAQLARDIDVPANRMTEIVAERRGITPDTAYRLGLYFRTGAKFWLNLQASYDLEELERNEGDQIKARIRTHAA